MQDQTWSEFISDVLSMLAYGFSFHEIVYKIRRGPLEKDPKFKSNYTDGKFGWQELPIRSQASLSEWTYDNSTGKVIEFVQETSQNPVKIPLDGNLLFRTKSNRNNPEGWSILRVHIVVGILRNILKSSRVSVLSVTWLVYLY